MTSNGKAPGAAPVFTDEEALQVFPKSVDFRNLPLGVPFRFLPGVMQTNRHSFGLKTSETEYVYFRSDRSDALPGAVLEPIQVIELPPIMSLQDRIVLARLCDGSVPDVE